MPIVTVHMPKRLIEKIDELVKKGVASSRSELIRQAVAYYINVVLRGGESGEEEAVVGW